MKEHGPNNRGGTSARFPHRAGRLAGLLLGIGFGLGGPAAAAEAPAHTPRFSRHIVPVLARLGCNAGGSKRLPEDSRDEWYAWIEDLMRPLHDRHDLALITLNKDKSQFAFVLDEPVKWRDSIDVEIRRAAKGFDIRRIWLKQEPLKFKQQVDVLFKTKREREKHNENRIWPL